MTDLIDRLGQVPCLPVAAWDLHDGTGLGIGLGDLLFATVFPIMVRKAFGGRPALLAATSPVCAIAAMLAAIDLRLVPTTIPAMLVLGPLIVAQGVLWRRLLGRERATGSTCTRDALGAEQPLRDGHRRARPRDISAPHSVGPIVGEPADGAPSTQL